MFKCKQFFLPLVYLCSEVIILILFLLKFMGASSLTDFFNERFELVQNTRYIKGTFCQILHLSYHKNFVSRGQFSFLVKLFLLVSLCSIGYFYLRKQFKKTQLLEFLRFLSFLLKRNNKGTQFQLYIKTYIKILY